MCVIQCLSLYLHLLSGNSIIFLFTYYFLNLLEEKYMLGVRLVWKNG